METLGPERATVRTIKWERADAIQRDKLETKAVDGTIPEAKVIQRHFYSPVRRYRGIEENFSRENWFPLPNLVASRGILVE